MRPNLARWMPALALALLAPLPSALAQKERAELRVDLGGGRIELHVGRGRAPRLEPRRTWIPGHYEVRHERVWVPGCTRQEWVPARYEWRLDSCGRRFQILIAPGHWITVTDPGRYELREARVWVPGYWATDSCAAERRDYGDRYDHGDRRDRDDRRERDNRRDDD
jgi:hypothetical protein